MYNFQEGDVVNVYFNDNTMLDLVVIKHVPSGIGDFWVFESKNGEIGSYNPCSSNLHKIKKMSKKPDEGIEIRINNAIRRFKNRTGIDPERIYLGETEYDQLLSVLCPWEGDVIAYQWLEVLQVKATSHLAVCQ